MKEQRHVGKNDPVYTQSQKEYLKFGIRNFRRKCRMTMSEAKGITLIALIITIIVLLILAMVSIKLVWDGGIINYAKYAVNKYNEAQQNEIEQLNAAFGENNDVPDEIAKFFLGEDRKGRNLYKVFSEATIHEEYNCVVLDNKLIVPMSYGDGVNELYVEVIETPIESNPNLSVYIVEMEKCEPEETMGSTDKWENFADFKSKSVSKAYTPTGIEGQKKTYAGQEWTVLYDNGDTVEMVSNDVMGNLTLSGVEGYNNAIAEINKYCESLIDIKDKNIKVRSIGSNPRNPSNENTTMYTSSFLEKDCSPDNGRTYINLNGKVKGEDKNYNQDGIRIAVWGLDNNSKDYWVASRSIYSNENQEIGTIRNGWYSNEGFRIVNLWKVNTTSRWNELHEYSVESPVRPVILIPKSLLN